MWLLPCCSHNKPHGVVYRGIRRYPSCDRRMRRGYLVMGLGSLGSPPNRGSNMCESLRQEGAEGLPKIRGPWGRKGMCVRGGRRGQDWAVKAVGGC